MRLLVLLGVVSLDFSIAEGEAGAKCLKQTCYCVNGTMQDSCLYRSGCSAGDHCETVDNGDNDEARLQNKLFKRYNPELRPVVNKTDRVTIFLGVSLHQIIDVDEKNQLVKVSLWVRQAWFNPFLTWNPSDYGGIAQININAKKAWIPDIYLYNNADEDSDGALDRFKTKIVLSSNGRNMWLAPVLYTFSCKVDVNFFPFDEQLCPMKFGSWTYDGHRLDVQMEAENGETKMYVSNGEWDLVGLPAQRNEMIYACCPEPYPDVTFTVHIRRRTTFYYINLIVPCALITSLTLLSFFLPPDSGERITLVITNLLAMTVFMLIVAEIMPATSEVIPLISIYYTGIMFEVALSLVATCMVLKCYYKNPSISEMPMWVRSVVLNKLAKIVRVQVPQGLIQNMEKHVEDEKEVKEEIEYERRNSVIPPPLGRRESCFSYNGDLMTRARSNTPSSGRNRAATLSTERVDPDAISALGVPKLMRRPDSLFSIDEEETYACSNPPICKQKSSFETALNDMLIKQHSILKNVRRLVDEIRRKEENEIKKEEWKIVAAIIDAYFFWLFMIVLIVSSVVIFLQAPQY